MRSAMPIVNPANPFAIVPLTRWKSLQVIDSESIQSTKESTLHNSGPQKKVGNVWFLLMNPDGMKTPFARKSTRMMFVLWLFTLQLRNSVTTSLLKVSLILRITWCRCRASERQERDHSFLLGYHSYGLLYKNQIFEYRIPLQFQCYLSGSSVIVFGSSTGGKVRPCRGVSALSRNLLSLLIQGNMMMMMIIVGSDGTRTE